MRAILGCGLAAVLAVAAGAPADDKKDTPIDEKKLVGRWEPKEAKKDAKMVLEFAKDGKMSLAVDFAGKAEKYDGTYKLTGNKLNVAVKFGEADIKQEVTVLKLTDDEMETEDPKGKKETLRRLKADK